MLNAQKLPLHKMRPPEIVTREMAYPRRDVWILLAVAVVVRLLLTCFNGAEYTDGVLQATQFTDPIGIWPPLYSALIYPLQFVIGYEWSGRLISAIASGVALLPLYWMTRRAFGTRAALYAGIFYITAPVANRWGVRVMTDATFSLFFWWACERMYFASDERDKKSAFRALGLASLFTVLASLTRYQGMMLIVPLAVVVGILAKRFKQFPIKPLLWLVGFAILPVWVRLIPEGFIHDEQFADRAFSTTIPLWKVMALNGEAFIAYMPYFLTYPVFVITLVGMFWTRQRRGPFFGWMTLYVGVVLLLAQSAFSSFQERYFLPLMGMFWCVAGSGMYALQERWHRTGRTIKARIFPYVMILTYVFSTFVTIAVVIGQREAFMDLAEASEFASNQADDSAHIFTNEIYRDEPVLIAGRKVAFYAKRKVQFLGPGYISADFTKPPVKQLPKGTLLVISSAYNGPYYEEYLNRYYRLSVVVDPEDETANPFHAAILPLFPDIMSTPGTAQNPSAWLWRYNWQQFTTTVYRVEGPR